MRSKATKRNGEDGGDVEDNIDDEREAMRRQVSQYLNLLLGEYLNLLLYLGSA